MRFLIFIVMLLAVVPLARAQQEFIMTVNGPIPLQEMGTTLVHEHILVDFIGADSTGYHRWDRREVMDIVRPYLEQAQHLGTGTIVECTPAFIGRDPLLLRKLSNQTGLHLITNTGYYGAGDNKFLPPHAYTETSMELAERWIREWKEGIEGTPIKPGFIKIGVNPGSLSPLHAKLVVAAAKTHLQTGLTIASHTGNAIPAFEQIELLNKEGVSAEAFIWVHAQGETDLQQHIIAAQKGAWISLDGLHETNLDQYLGMVQNLKNHGLLNKVLLSHDAGWFSPGEANGGSFRDYSVLFEKFIPLLFHSGFSNSDIEQLLLTNPQKAVSVKIRSWPNKVN